ncbi:DUF7093 family protein [Halodesulfurarchaeum formicicum]|uniref:Uncharacterized protein n=1 Tax=Halodesulfurarchaeum formicicum TaxID=1873524 RepID=A0A1J1AEC7_9EURY|nr:hypothetical protein [Halodesulfurarchaeum formicicum]APE96096.1 hypothetical protein HSR6_1657 [Halodesulfurarchaeum formicicum]
MGLRCSLLGHAFGEPVTERDREQRGDEAVVTIRKIKTCDRCGAEQVISENTEVRHLGAADSEPEPEPESEPAPVSESAEAEADTAVDVSELVEDAEAEPSVEADTDESITDTEPSVETDTDESIAEGEDAVILDDSAGPDEATTEPDDSEPASPESVEEVDTVESEDTGVVIEDEPADATADTAEPASMFGTETEESMAEPTDPAEASGPADSETATDTPTETTAAAESTTEATDTPAEPDGETGAGDEAEPSAATAETDESPIEGTGDWPAADQEAATDAAAETGGWSASPPGDEEPPADDDPAFQFDTQSESAAAEPASGNRGPSGITSEGPLEVDEDPDSPAQSLECPECGFTEGPGSSLRAGDICPECHRGYLAGRR